MEMFRKGSEARFTFEIQGAPEIEVTDFRAIEELSKPFVVTVSLAGKEKISYDDVVLKEALLTIRGAETDRCFHGVVGMFRMLGKSGRKYLYDAEIVPSFTMLSLKQDSRLFQKTQVQEIIACIFKESGISPDRFVFRLKNKEHARKFCVQFEETNLDFISRLLEEEGIYYFFEHFRDRHVIVFADDPICYKPIEGTPKLTFKPESGLNPEKEVISEIDFSRRLCSGEYAHTNDNFKRPSVDLMTNEKSGDEEDNRYEIYDYPGPYGDTGQGRRIAKVRLEENLTLRDQAEGKSTCPRMIPGFTFTLNGYDVSNCNIEYLIVAAVHSGSQPQTLEEHSGPDSGTAYENCFQVIPSSVSYRPLREHKKPIVKGMLSAVVVGPQGEEIYTDGHGRLKVQFHWDRTGKRDERSSCWLRCIQAWGGDGRGMVFLPRVGTEVLVDFIEGDPDRPMIMGSLYNGDNMPPYNLPGHKTRSTIRTKSYPNSKGFNELRFEDRAGNEEIFIHGEKDWNIVVKNDKGQAVGHDETLSIANNRTKTVGINQNESIGANKTIGVGANHSESIGSNMSLSVGTSKNETVSINSSETVGAAKELTTGGLYQVSVGGMMNETVGLDKSEEVMGLKALVVGAHMTEYVAEDRKSTVEGNLTKVIKGIYISKTDEYILEADEITLKAGDALIIMNKDSITIKGKLDYQTPDGTVISPESKEPQYDEKFQLIDANTGEPHADYQYKLKTESGTIIEGRTDAKGYTQRIQTDKKGKIYFVMEEE